MTPVPPFVTLTLAAAMALGAGASASAQTGSAAAAPAEPATPATPTTPAAPAAAPAVAPVAAPAGCGFVAASEGVIPESEGIYRVTVTQVDGKSATSTRRHRVDAGTVTLTVSERIPFHSLSGSEIHEIKRMKRRGDANAYQTLQLDVEPGMTYRIGARLHRDRLDTASIEANEYWEPVVWETVPTKCR